MKRIRTYQFVRTSEPGRFFEYIDRINKLNSTAVFDLEDAALVPFDEKQTNRNKSAIRKEITSLLLSDRNTNQYLIGIRVNSPANLNFSLDLEFLKKINKNISWDCIFLPKIQNKTLLEKCIKLFENHRIRFKEVIPIIESEKGIKNLSEILSAKADSRFNNIAFGHCDYNLNCNNFPFIHHNTKDYYKIINPIIRMIEKSNFGYVNSPFLELNNIMGFRKNLGYLHKICANNFSQVTLTLEQTKLCNNYEKNLNGFHFPKSVVRIDKITGRQIAKSIISEFLSNLIPGKSFALTKEKRKLISPQEYQSAINYIIRTKND
jgi:hypothetical protein